MNAQDIFLNAPKEASPEELAAYLAEACGADDALKQRVVRMLEVAGRLGDFMANGTPTLPLTNEDDPPVSEDVGSVVGNYKLLQEIGVGGFGVVYMAEQLRPVKRRVAFKIIKLGMDTRQVVARFEAERQALAMMDHPNIAKVHDAGSTESGRPYFVMELVKGIPITTFCDDQHLSAEQRLRLFIDVCSAVQHAHQKGVIHRDLKPSNVMVTMHDDKAVPKVIDFGVAKATQTELTEKTLFTQFEQFIGTPAYMSPEQAQMSGLDIDTRSDIYALGVLLYELLTGRTPFDQKQLAKVGLDEIRRVIREDDPPKPSTKVSALADAELTALATRRSSDPRKLRASFRGDLDWIVMKCLEKDRARRYETANGLAMDVRRALADEPVVAGPPGLAYQVTKMVRRHRTALGVAAAVAVILVAGTVISTRQAIEASRARDSEFAARLELRDQLGKTETAKGAAERNEKIIAFRLAEEHLGSGKVDLGIAQLANLVRAEDDPALQRVAAARLVSALWQRDYPRPAVRTLQHKPYGTVQTAFSADGSLIVTGGSDSMLKVWETRTGRLLKEFPSGSRILDVAISPDGRRVASAGGLDLEGGWAMAWDRITGEHLYTLTHSDDVQVVEFSPDGTRVLTLGDDGVSRVWDGESGAPVTPILDSGELPVTTGSFSPDGRQVVTGGHHQRVTLWDAATGAQLIDPLPHPDTVWSVRYSPDGSRLVTGCEDGSARVWNAATGDRIGTPMKHGDRVQFAEFDPQGKLIVTASLDSTARIWDAATGWPVSHPLVHGARVVSARFNPDGSRVITAAFDGTAQVWETATGQRVGPALRHVDLVGDARFSPDGKRALTGGDGVARLWDVRPSQPLSQIFRHPAAPGWTFDPGVMAGAFRHDGRWIVTSGADGTVRIWDVGADSLIHSLDVVRPSSVVMFSPDDTLLGIGGTTGSRIIDAESGLLKLDLVTNKVRDIAFSPDGTVFLTASVIGEANDTSGIVQVWDVAAGEKVGRPMIHGRSVQTIRLSPHDGGRRVLVASFDATASIWDTATSERIHRLGVPDDTTAMTDAEWHPEGDMVVTVYVDGAVKFWDAMTGELLGGTAGHSKLIQDVEFSPDGSLMVTASNDGTAQLWDVAARRRHALPMRHEGPVTKAAFSPDGGRIATSSKDGSIRVWDTQFGLPLTEPLEHGATVWFVAFSPDGEQVLATGQNAAARLWDVPSTAEAVPDWLPEWAEAVVELRLGMGGEATAVEWEETVALTKRLSSLEGGDYYSRTARWFYADPRERMITPLSELTTRHFVANRLLEGTVESIEEAIRVDPGNGIALAQLASLLQPENGEMTPDKRIIAENYARQAEQALRRMIEEDRDDPASWLALLLFDPTGTEIAGAVDALGREAEAISKGAAADLDHVYLVSLGESAARALRPEQQLVIREGTIALQRAVEPLAPTTRSAMRELVTLAIMQEDWKRARRISDVLIHESGEDLQTTEDWMKLAAIHLSTGQHPDYERLCEAMVSRYGQAELANSLERTAKACLAVQPRPGASYVDQAFELARAATELARQDLEFMALCQAMAEYRNGQPEQALKWLSKAETSDALRHCRALAHPYHAMAAHQLGRTEEAREHLQQAEEAILSLNEEPEINWHDRIFAQLALKEAQDLLATPANPR